MERILITGSSRGIGRATALRLAGAGRELLLAGRDRAALAGVAAEVEDRGGRAVPLVFDLGVEAEVLALAEAVGQRPLAAIVNNAGVAVVKPFTAIGLEQWRQALEVNVTAPFLLCQRLVAAMPAGAAIVNVLSVAARTGFPGWSSYCATKFALEGLSQCLREELRERGVRVVNVYPAATATALWDAVEGEWPRERMLDAEQVAEAIAWALDRPPHVVVDTLSVGTIAGNL